MIKRFAKGAFAITATFGCWITGVMAYGAGGSFNPIYSGKFSCTENCYMTISEDDAVMHRIFYPISAQTTRFLSASNADSLVFTKDHFEALYNHQCSITYSDGTFVKSIDGPILIQASEVQVNKVNIWGQPKVMTIVYNGHDYTSG